MNTPSAFESWAPLESPWSPWVKPVLFAHGPSTFPPGFDTEPWKNQTMPQLPDVSQRMALVMDLPGGESVDAGLVAARAGYRPVPLYNAVTGPSPLVDVSVIRHRLICDADNLRGFRIARDAPPCFLTDINRDGRRRSLRRGFDNRWVLLPQDFPSARFLLSQDIRAICVVIPQDRALMSDLAHVLHGWQTGGLNIHLAVANRPEAARRVNVSRPSHFGRIWYRWLVLLGLRRHSGGGFGALIPQPSASYAGGGFG
ncbi:MAG TPA: hypothetical protein PKE12_11025 [Kiritimatiellia bacterium]|nr:hypothetical protein [Kiritimatiellia bacterium]